MWGQKALSESNRDDVVSQWSQISHQFSFRRFVGPLGFSAPRQKKRETKTLTCCQGCCVLVLSMLTDLLITHWTLPNCDGMIWTSVVLRSYLPPGGGPFTPSSASCVQSYFKEISPTWSHCFVFVLAVAKQCCHWLLMSTLMLAMDTWYCLCFCNARAADTWSGIGSNRWTGCRRIQTERKQKECLSFLFYLYYSQIVSQLPGGGACDENHYEIVPSDLPFAKVFFTYLVQEQSSLSSCFFNIQQKGAWSKMVQNGAISLDFNELKSQHPHGEMCLCRKKSVQGFFG